MLIRGLFNKNCARKTKLEIDGSIGSPWHRKYSIGGLNRIYIWYLK